MSLVTNHLNPETCTVTVSLDERCGRPAVSSFVSRSGETLRECSDHAVVVAAAAVVKDSLEGESVVVSAGQHSGAKAVVVVDRKGRTSVDVRLANGKVVRVLRSSVR